MAEQEAGAEPAHHARRPMNAFLIFCKRHRSVVRDKYPNLENRSITKILGEWWANLDKEEKSCYTGLAKQYKDAFFNAHPDFKWYKLPAPPLRTLAARTSRELPDRPDTEPDTELERTNNNSTKVDFNKPNDFDEPKTLSMFTPGKLADEAHMGGLSSLLETKTETPTPNPYYSPPSFKYAISNIRSQVKGNKDDTIRELQNALTETTKVFEEDFDKTQIYSRYNGPEYQVPNEFTNQDVIDQIVDKRYLNEEQKWSDDEKNTKSGRSCKGKRYQEFMAVGLIASKRQKRDADKSPEHSFSASWEPGSSRSDSNSTITDDSKPLFEEQDADAQDNNMTKTFKAADFDLDAKIRALPSLSLEKFQQKKRENKRKKKTVNLKPKAPESSQIINSVPRPVDERSVESWRDNVIGSQKRKPRKISITRFEINSMVSKPDVYKSSPEMKVATEAPCTVAHTMDRQSSANDLLALATLAEVAANVAANTCLDSAITAKASDNASTV